MEPLIDAGKERRKTNREHNACHKIFQLIKLNRRSILM